MQYEYLFGIHAVKTALKRDARRVHKVLLLQGRRDQKIQDLETLAKTEHIRVQWVSKIELEKLAENQVHQGAIALCEPMRAQSESDLVQLLDGLQTDPFLLVLDGVTDPHNLGACLRTADAAGVHAVIAPKDKSAPLNTTVAKVACGAAEVVPYVQVTNLSRCLKMLQERGIWITGTAGEAEQEHTEANLKGPMALVMGAEGQGMRRLTREFCDQLIKIPMAGEVSSLNVSVATGVCLFEMLRQRKT